MQFARDATRVRSNAARERNAEGSDVEAIRAVPEMHNAYALMHACHDRFRGIVLSGSRSSLCREWKPTTIHVETHDPMQISFATE